ncbi:5'-nucleotidase C-terminal domain-containing protein [uncultured Fusobacterium sp.]|uniref:5'-nucleotidase C-terminal domain-containing protein n=1 Tax=uncultured Fusobacterium sp. TaxID=159267 RepID=UPI0027DBF472|nr:5'-nucleotidase C-terminal domain-containing protein [uncultured Fusobacterium sp.]
MKKLKMFLGVLSLVLFSNISSFAKEIDIQILATSDLHGKFYPYDYAINEESKSGSLTQIATAVKKYRTDNTIIVDVGDTIQDNYSEMFFKDKIHPMMLAMNEIGYDIWAIGNHEFNYGVENLKNIMKQSTSKVLIGNLYNPDGTSFADSYTIIEKDGVKIGVIGMCTPNITKWDSVNLKDYIVTDPVEETKKIVKDLRDKVDVLIATVHMGEENEYDVPNSGANDLANACPELDLIIAAHEHKLVEETYVDNVLIVENKSSGATMSKVNIVVEKDKSGCKIVDRKAESIKISEYESDKELSKKLAPYNERAKKEANIIIGELVGGNLVPENEIVEIPQAQIEPTSLIDLINEVQMYYTDAQVSSAALFNIDANLEPGKIKKSDTSLIYKYGNTLYKVQMTGKQLKKYMEWSANYYNTYNPKDLTISFNENVRGFNYDMFSGVDYQIDISEKPGNRIKNLKWTKTGKEVKDNEVFVIAVNNYRVNTHLLSYGEIYEEGEELPKVLEIDVNGKIGGVRELIGDYIKNVKGGKIAPNNPKNWEIIGNNWDEEKHKKAVQMIREGKIKIPSSQDGRTPNVKSITEDDLK